MSRLELPCKYHPGRFIGCSSTDVSAIEHSPDIRSRGGVLELVEAILSSGYTDMRERVHSKRGKRRSLQTYKKACNNSLEMQRLSQLEDGFWVATKMPKMKASRTYAAHQCSPKSSSLFFPIAAYPSVVLRITCI